MPIMNGLTAALEIRKLERVNNYPYTSIYGISGTASRKESCLACGMDMFLQTPVNMHELVYLVLKEFSAISGSFDK